MNLKDLCLNLAYTDTENGIINILEKSGFWNDPSNWQYFGNRENNYGSIGNQQSKADGALVEKLINSVDAVLMADDQMRQYSDHSYNQPSSIKEALEKFYNIFEGKLSNIDAKARTSLAQKISLVATGKKSKPNYSVIDLGEGQSPKNIPNTLLSLGESNKLRIPFVQGKFNMGGTGVFRFCGKNNLQLIISKRHPELAKYESDSDNKLWGFTIIRRENPTNDVRSSTYKYLAPQKKILTFSSEEGLPLLPSAYPDPYGKNLNWGTFIKLYEYQIGGYNTIITLNLLYRLSLLLPQIALPIRLYERRKNYSPHTFETTLSGLDVRLEEDKRNNLEEGFPTTGSINVSGQKIKYSIFAFKKGKSETYTKSEGIIFVINGQTHGNLSKSFFTRNKVGLSYLEDSILVILDCSEFDGRSREDLFKNDRETLIHCSLKSEIERFLEDELKNHKGLKELKERRKREEIENKLEDSKPLAEVLNNILKNSPTLSRLFIQGLKLSNPLKVDNSGTNIQYIGNRFPSYFTLVKKYNEDNHKIVNCNSRFRIQYKTDVTNDYFDRSKDPGTFKLYLNGNEIESFSINLWNGFATLSIPTKNYTVGEVIKFESIVSDVNNLANPFEEEFHVKIVDTKNNNGTNGQRRKPGDNSNGKDSKKQEQLSIPNIIPVKRETWKEHGFDEYTAVKVKGSEEDGYEFFINVDNIHLLTELKSKKEEEIKLVEARYKYGMVLIGLAILNDKNIKENENIFDKVFSVTKTISPILLPMITSLGDLELEEKETSYIYN